MEFQASGNRPPMLNKDSDFVKWTVDFMDFISRRENGDLMIKSFTEGPLILYKREEDFTEEEIYRKRADKDATLYLIIVISKLPQYTCARLNAFKNNPMLLWKELTKLMHGSYVDFRVKKVKNADKEDTNQTTSEIHIEEPSKAEEKKVDLEKKEDMKDVIEDSEKITELTKRLSDLEKLIKDEREEHKKEREGLALRISDLEKELKMKTKVCEDNKVFELKFKRLSKQNSDFQKVLFLEKQKVEKERAEFEVKRKELEVKNGKLTEKLSELQMEMDRDCEELERMKKADFQAKSVKDDFCVERKIFQQEIQS